MKNIYILLIICFLPFFSCIDDDFIGEYEEQESFVPDKDQYALSFLVTLDRMGGPSTRAEHYNPMEYMES